MLLLVLTSALGVSAQLKVGRVTNEVKIKDDSGYDLYLLKGEYVAYSEKTATSHFIKNVQKGLFVSVSLVPQVCMANM